MKPRFQNYLSAWRHCVAAGIDVARVQRESLHRWVILARRPA